MRQLPLFILKAFIYMVVFAFLDMLEAVPVVYYITGGFVGATLFGEIADL